MNGKHLSWVLPLFMLGSSAPTQQPPLASGDAAATIVELGHALGPPVERMAVPVKLTSGPGVKVGKLELTIAFPKASLTFLALEPSGLTSGIEADVKAEVKDDEKDANQQLLLLTISTLDGKTTRLPFPNGTLAYVLFQVAKDAKPKTMIAINATGTAVSVEDSSKAVAPLSVRTSSLEVSEDPWSACFFYMH